MRIENNRGERSRTAKLTDKQVEEIRESDKPSKELAELYGVCAKHIRQIQRGVARKHKSRRWYWDGYHRNSPEFDNQR